MQKKLQMCVFFCTFAANLQTMQKPSFVSVIILAMLLMAGCSNRQPEYRIGVSQCLDDAWRQKMNEEMERELLLYPHMRITQRRIAYGSNALQCAQIDSFIGEKVDLLIVSPNEAEAVTPAVSRAYRAGIPVIVADRRVSGEDWTAFIGGDNYQVGVLMAEWIQKVQSETDHPLRVLEVCGLPGSVPEMLRHQGLMERLQESEIRNQKSEVRSVDGSTDAYHEVAAYLSGHKDVDAIVAQNDLMAIEASRAVQDAGLNHVRIMGVDGIDAGLHAVVDGVIECTATYPSRGDLLIATAARIVAGEPFVRDTVLETYMVDANIAEALLKQYEERAHDIEIVRIARIDSNTQWQQMRSDRRILIVVNVLICLLFFAALGFLIYTQLRLQSEIKNDVLPQLEDVQEAIALTKRDELFAERVKKIVDEHLTDPNLNMDLLESTLLLSRTQIFRRMKKATGKAPADYIRERRLERADELLRTTDKTVREVALELCFAKPGYFSKCYNDYFGHMPSELLKS